MKKLFFLLLFWASSAFGVTRFYLQKTISAPVSSANNNVAWSDTTQRTGPWRMFHTTTSGNPMTTTIFNTVGTTDKDSVLCYKFCSYPLVGGTTSGATFKGQIRCDESANADNTTVACALYITNPTGDTLRGVFFNTAASDGTTRPPEMALSTLTNRQFQNQAEATSIGMSNLTWFDGDLLWFEAGFRENTTTAANPIELSVGDDAATDLAEDNTTTAANNPWFETTKTFTFLENPGSDQSVQLTPGCATVTGDTLYPVGAGTATGLTKGGDGTGGCTFNWECMSGTPGSSGCDADNDTVYLASTTAATDYYKLGRHTEGSSTRWGQRGNANRIVDCISVSACVHIGQAASGTMEVTLGLRDSAGNEVWGALNSSTITANRVVIAHCPNQNLATVWGSTRWDSVSMLGLEVMLRLRITNATNRQAVAKNVYAIVFAHDRDTALLDSTNADMQTLACSTSVAVNFERQSGAFESPINKNRIWLGWNRVVTVDEPMLSASNDTGRTWYWLSTTSDGNNTDDFGANIPDTVTIYKPGTNDGFGTTGLYLFGDSTATDSFHIGAAENAGLDSAQLWQTKQRQQIQSELAARADKKTVPTNGGVSLFYPAFFSLADTIWMVEGTALTNGRLRWHRSKDRGQTWPDSGYIQGPGCVRDQDTGTIATSTGFRRVAFVRWSGGYPGIFINGWLASGHSFKTTFMHWHPAVTNVDSMRLHAWFRDDNAVMAQRDTVTAANIAPSNNSEMAATSVFGGTDADTMAHVCFVTSNRVIHASVTKAGVRQADTVVEISTVPSGNLYVSMVSLDMKYVYVFWNMFKNATVTPTTTDTCFIMFSRLCTDNDHRWIGPRPLSWLRSTDVQMKFMTTAQYQWAHMTVGMFTHATRGTASPSNALANRIIRRVATAPAGGENEGKRRRKVIENIKSRKAETDDEKMDDAVLDFGGMALTKER